MPKLFLCDYEYYDANMIKCRQTLNFEEMDTNGFWLLGWIFKEYIKQNIIMVVLRNPNSHSVVICRLI